MIQERICSGRRKSWGDGSLCAIVLLEIDPWTSSSLPVRSLSDPAQTEGVMGTMGAAVGDAGVDLSW